MRQLNRGIRPPVEVWPSRAVVRRIDMTADAARRRLDEVAALDGGRRGRLCVHGPFRKILTSDVPIWEADGHLTLSGGRLPRTTVVRLEVTAWNADSCELTLRSTARWFDLWGDRRLRRYFTAAHDAADDLVRRLNGDRATVVITAPATVAGTRPMPHVVSAPWGSPKANASFSKVNSPRR